MRFINAIWLGIQVAHDYYRNPPDKCRLVISRRFGVTRLAFIVAEGRESWRLYELMRRYYLEK